MATEKRKCANCRWAEKIGADPAHRECRVDSPKVLTVVGSSAPGYWPVVDKNAWCRAWNLEGADWP